MSYFKIKSYAKINLALNILEKKDLLHKIESIVSFIYLHDQILIKKIKNKKHKIKFVGQFANDIKLKNTVSQLFEYLEKKELLIDKFQIIIKKNIPSKAGFGGGSMNAASILNYFIKQKIIKVSQKQIVEIANSVGSDVILGIYSKNLILKSNNSIKTFSIKKKIFTLLVKPNFGCSTELIYSAVKKYSRPQLNHSSKDIFRIESLKNMKNDLELIALNKYSKLNVLKEFLEKLSRVEFVRMTGSGSAIIAYFNSDKKCKDAEKKVKNRFRNYWCKTSKTI